MKIVIAGAGEVGSHLAKLLSNEEQDIVIVDSNQSRLQTLDQKYNLMTVAGYPASFKALRDADTANCDLFIAVMPSEANNIVACAIAKQMGAKCTVARIENYDYMAPGNVDKVRLLGVDHLIYPEYLAAQQIVTSLRRTWVRQWFEILNGEIIVVGVRIGEQSKMCGMQLKDFAFKHRYFHVSAIKRGHETLIPRGDDRMEVNDILYVTTTHDHVNDLLEMTGKVEHHIKRVLIMGGTKIAIRVLDIAGDEFKFTIVDKNRGVCDTVAQKCPNADEIYCGDARDMDMLSDIGIDHYDAFIALSDSSETNILACLTAKEIGMKKTVAEVEDIQFINQAERLNIGSVVNKKLLASSRIFQLLLDKDSSTSKCLALSDAEVAELEVRPGSKITRALVKDLSLPHDLTLAGLIRDNKGMLVTGMTRICPGDHVVVFCLSGAIHKAEKLFS